MEQSPLSRQVPTPASFFPPAPSLSLEFPYLTAITKPDSIS